MKTGNFTNRRRGFPKASGFLAICATAFGLVDTLHAQTTEKRCDWVADSLPGSVGGGSACVDITRLSSGTAAITLPSNTTRIGTEGLELCRNAFSVVQSGTNSDIAYVYDNSGSMAVSHYYVNGTDTLYYYGTGSSGGGGNNTCATNAGTGQPTMVIQVWNAAGTALVNDTITRMASNVGCVQNSGDPFNARGRAFRLGIQSQAALAPTSMAGIMSFTGSCSNPPCPPLVGNIVRPLVLSAANVNTLIGGINAVSGGGTDYSFPLDTSVAWLTSASITPQTAGRNKAVIFLSDGQPQNTNYLPLASNTPPVYGIFLGKDTVGSGRLRDLSDSTGGTFYLIPPNRPDSLSSVIATIVRNIIVSALPQSVTFRNTSYNPDQISVADNMVWNTEGNLSLSLDSILGLLPGSNELQIEVDYGDSTRTYNLTVNANGPVAGGTNSTVTCYDQPTLVMLRNGVEDSIYPPGPSNYTIRLVRPTSDLGSVTIGAISMDSLRPSFGDSETVILAQQSGGGTYQISGYPVNGSSSTPLDGNGTLESDLDGLLVLTWTNPRDARETARYELPGRKIVSLVDVVVINRLTRYGGGVDIGGGISDPVVLRSGVVYTNVGGNLVVTNGGTCISNCGDIPRLLTEGLTLPSFEFKTMAPFSYSIYLYDHLGQFVRTATGRVDNTVWQGLAKDSTGAVAVVMTVIPVAQDGRQCGTGVYILKATIRTETVVTTDSQNNQVRVVGTTKRLIKQFGYLREGK